MKYDTWESFIQYVSSMNPKRQRALRFGFYRICDSKRTSLHGSVYFEISMVEDLRKKMEETETPALKTALKETFG